MIVSFSCVEHEKKLYKLRHRILTCPKIPSCRGSDKSLGAYIATLFILKVGGDFPPFSISLSGTSAIRIKVLPLKAESGKNILTSGTNTQIKHRKMSGQLFP